MKKSLGYWSLPILLCVSALLLPHTKEAGVLELSSEAGALQEKPWTLVSYCLAHQTILHLALSVFLLSLLIVLGKVQGGVFWALFVIGVFAGGVSFLLLFPLSGFGDGSLVGASAGICSLAPITLYRAFSKKGDVLGHALAWALMLVLVADFVSFIVIGSPGFLSHIGGYIAGAAVMIPVCANERADRERTAERERIHSKAARSGIGSLSAKEWEIVTHKREV